MERTGLVAHWKTMDLAPGPDGLITYCGIYGLAYKFPWNFFLATKKKEDAPFTDLCCLCSFYMEIRSPSLGVISLINFHFRNLFLEFDGKRILSQLWNCVFHPPQITKEK